MVGSWDGKRGGGSVDPTERTSTEGEERRDRRVHVLPSQRKAWYLEINPDSWVVFRGGLM